MSKRSEVLADRLAQGTAALASLAESLTEQEWTRAVPHDGRTVGVMVHHVGNMYPLEIGLAQTMAAGKPVEGVTMDQVHEINAAHAKEKAGVTKAEAVAFLRTNGAAAAAALRAFSDADLDRAVAVSLYNGAPVTTQFMLEDHAVRHSYHHAAVIRRTLGR